jgi:hypothetical protein
MLLLTSLTDTYYSNIQDDSDLVNQDVRAQARDSLVSAQAREKPNEISKADLPPIGSSEEPDRSNLLTLGYLVSMLLVTAGIILFFQA